MKCYACGFENEKKSFIEILPDCGAELPEPLFFWLCLPNEPHYHSRLFACPKCGTVKVEVQN